MEWCGRCPKVAERIGPDVELNLNENSIRITKNSDGRKARHRSNPAIETAFADRSSSCGPAVNRQRPESHSRQTGPGSSGGCNTPGRRTPFNPGYPGRCQDHACARACAERWRFEIGR